MVELQDASIRCDSSDSKFVNRPLVAHLQRGLLEMSKRKRMWERVTKQFLNTNDHYRYQAKKSATQISASHFAPALSCTPHHSTCSHYRVACNSRYCLK